MREFWWNLIGGNDLDLIVTDRKNTEFCQGVNLRIQRGYPVPFQMQLCQTVHVIKLIRWPVVNVVDDMMSAVEVADVSGKCGDDSCVPKKTHKYITDLGVRSKYVMIHMQQLVVGEPYLQNRIPHLRSFQDLKSLGASRTTLYNNSLKIEHPIESTFFHLGLEIVYNELCNYHNPLRNPLGRPVLPVKAMWMVVLTSYTEPFDKMSLKASKSLIFLQVTLA
ncbi:hypothetical protein CEXT_769611 [Caerostris extrusa]|uniref:Uncharacterized protein n=1 Tax=Caerostris extrusa TaxID=172846 RepID=A0AAV4U386_CAEEX|nr:hypothetical protein CEXT_769611 [Caerostris extrusa]